jgi:hypothetical protein
VSDSPTPPGGIPRHARACLGPLPEGRLAVGDVERDDPGFAVVGAFEPFGGGDELGFAEAGGELEHGLVGDRDPCEPHDDDRTHVRVLAKVSASDVWRAIRRADPLAATLHLRRRAVGLTKDQAEQVQADDEHERHDSEPEPK